MGQQQQGSAFDPEKWRQDCGAEILLSKDCNFDYKEYSVRSFVAISKRRGYYYTINSYSKEGGDSFANHGGSKYPLKGRTVKTSRAPITGKKTAQEILDRFLRNGYKTVINELEKDKK